MSCTLLIMCTSTPGFAVLLLSLGLPVSYVYCFERLVNDLYSKSTHSALNSIIIYTKVAKCMINTCLSMISVING